MKSKDRVVIFGAAGKVGSLLVEYALADGYAVTAFVHRHHNLPSHPNLIIAKGDVYDKSEVQKALQDADVVLSALSSWGTPKKDVLSAAMATIVPTMKERGIDRIISLTGSEARASGDRLSVIHRLAHIGIGVVGGKVLRDGERHIKLLEQSGLDWTVVRSPIMRSGSSRRYTLSSNRPLPWGIINRQAVARAMVDQIDTPHRPKAVFIH